MRHARAPYGRFTVAVGPATGRGPAAVFSRQPAETDGRTAPVVYMATAVQRPAGRVWLAAASQD